MKFVTTYRTRLSQCLGIAFLLLYLVSAKPLESVAPVLTNVLFLLGCVLAGAGAIGRLWCAQYIAGYKDGVLVREGPYSVCRNPLYFFSFLGAVGVGLCTESLTLTLLLMLVFVLLYPGVIRSEERKLLRLFGQPYADYLREVPRFLPSPRLYHEPADYVVKPRVFRQAALDDIWFVWAIGVMECLEAVQETGLIPALCTLY